MTKLSDLLARDHQVHSVGPTDTVFKAVEVMSTQGQSAMVVMDGPKLVGIISEQDISRRVILKGLNSTKTQIKDVMTSQIFTVEATTPVERVLALMNQADVRHMPVVTGNKVVGFVSILDVVEANLNEKTKLINQLEKYVSETWPL